MINPKLKDKLVIIGIIVVFAVLIFLTIRVFSGEDDWIKDSKGLWIKHGNPASTPSYVKEQQEAISCASDLYAGESLKNINFSNQCLGTCGNYSIDIVHVPRMSEDDLKENQCSDFLSGKTKSFIELNSQGNIVRIV